MKIIAAVCGHKTCDDEQRLCFVCKGRKTRRDFYAIQWFEAFKYWSLFRAHCKFFNSCSRGAAIHSDAGTLYASNTVMASGCW